MLVQDTVLICIATIKAPSIQINTNYLEQFTARINDWNCSVVILLLVSHTKHMIFTVFCIRMRPWWYFMSHIAHSKIAFFKGLSWQVAHAPFTILTF